MFILDFMPPIKHLHFLLFMLRLGSYFHRKFQSTRRYRWQMKKKQMILLLLTLLLIGIIFGFSLNSGQSSNLQSNEVTDTLRPFAHVLGIHDIGSSFLSQIIHPRDITLAELLIRKLAHFSEYLFVGVLIGLFSSTINSNKIRLAVMVFAGAIVALIDEKLIQAYFTTGRTSSFIDVGIDCSGYFVGLLAIIFLIHLTKNVAARKNQNTILQTKSIK
jgi:VanZ family protein